MPFHYDPKDASSAWEKADYDARLEHVENTHSQTSGEDMQVLHLRVFHSDGREQVVKDYIVKKTLWKLRALAKALGKGAQFEAGTFQAEDCLGSNLTVELRVDAARDGFDEKNAIAKLKPAVVPASPALGIPERGGPGDDEIPF